jgi:hypothetical protein
MNFENRIIRYVSKRDSSPLVFSTSMYSIINIDTSPYDTNDINELISFVLDKSYYFNSWNVDKNKFETLPDKWRSSLDIWRHIKYYNDSYDIFDVMKALSNTDNFKMLRGHFCPDVKRRVFKHSTHSGYWGRRLFPGFNDEYGVSLIYWINHFWPENRNWYVDNYDKRIYIMREEINDGYLYTS